MLTSSYSIGELAWSKLESGRLPSLTEFKSLIDQEQVTFRTTAEPLPEVDS